MDTIDAAPTPRQTKRYTQVNGGYTSSPPSHHIGVSFDTPL